jgi:hypothetical protein
MGPRQVYAIRPGVRFRGRRRQWFPALHGGHSDAHWAIPASSHLVCRSHRFGLPTLPCLPIRVCLAPLGAPMDIVPRIDRGADDCSGSSVGRSDQRNLRCCDRDACVRRGLARGKKYEQEALRRKPSLHLHRGATRTLFEQYGTVDRQRDHRSRPAVRAASPSMAEAAGADSAAQPDGHSLGGRALVNGLRQVRCRRRRSYPPPLEGGCRGTPIVRGGSMRSVRRRVLRLQRGRSDSTSTRPNEPGSAFRQPRRHRPTPVHGRADEQQASLGAPAHAMACLGRWSHRGRDARRSVGSRFWAMREGEREAADRSRT